MLSEKSTFKSQNKNGNVAFKKKTNVYALWYRRIYRSPVMITVPKENIIDYTRTNTRNCVK